jgi:lipopolysaccharide heptosyltransferase II
MDVLRNESEPDSEIRLSLELPPVPQCRKIALLHDGRDSRHMELVLKTLKSRYPDANIVMITTQGKTAGIIRPLRSEQFDLLVMIVSYHAYLSKVIHMLSSLGFVLLSGARRRTIYVSTWRGLYSLSEIVRENKKKAFRSLVRICIRGARVGLLHVMYRLGEWIFPILNRKPRGETITHERVQRILVIQLDLLGDVVWATSSFQILRKAFPSAEIDLLVGSWSNSLMEGCPFLDRVITYDSPWFIREATFAKSERLYQRIWRNLSIRTYLVKREYDLTVDLRGEAQHAVLAYLTGAPYRVGSVIRSVTGLDPRDVGFMLTHEAPYPWEERHQRHIVEQNARVLRAIGIDEAPPDPLVQKTPETEERVTRLLLDHEIDAGKDLVVGIHPGASREEKKWKKEGFAAVADECVRKLGAKVVFTGSASDKSLVQEIASKMRYSTVNLAGKTSLPEFVSLVGRFHLIIANETSTISVASAVKTPIICLMSGVPNLYGPYNVPNRVLLKEIECRNPIIEHCNCPFTEYKCLQMISPEEVMDAVEGLLAEIREPYRNAKTPIG